MSARVAVLLSGRGSNFLNLHAAMERGEVPATVALVISNVAEAPGLARARQLGLPALALPHGDSPTREAHDERMRAAIAAAGAEWVCLAGYMRLLTPGFVAACGQRVLNIHPSLLPSFPGLHAQRQALAAGVRVSGCTVHFVDAGLDSGPIVEQRAVPVLDSDDEDSLAARILEAEHAAYPAALARLLAGGWWIAGRRVRFPGPGA
jgi:phosphoribosylglycinamide formyltransferase-1